MKKIIIIILSSLLLSCTYSFNMNSLPHLDSILIHDVSNSSEEPIVEETLKQKLIALFQEDGRLNLVTKKPDSELTCQIKDYQDDIGKYDENEIIIERKVEIVIAIQFYDNVTNEMVYENENLKLKEHYAISDISTLEISSEEEAYEEIVNRLFNTIISNTLEKW